MLKDNIFPHIASASGELKKAENILLAVAR